MYCNNQGKMSFTMNWSRKISKSGALEIYFCYLRKIETKTRRMSLITLYSEQNSFLWFHFKLHQFLDFWSKITRYQLFLGQKIIFICGGQKVAYTVKSLSGRSTFLILKIGITTLGKSWQIKLPTKIKRQKLPSVVSRKVCEDNS